MSWGNQSIAAIIVGLPTSRKIRHTANRLTAERFETYFQIASELGFQSISYEHLANWMNGTSIT